MFKVEYQDSIKAGLMRLGPIGAGVTMLVAIACGPITAQDAQQILDTGREIQRLQQTEILPRVGEIQDLQFDEIEPRRLRLEEIHRQIRQVEMGSSLLDILDRALSAASDGEIISADDGNR